MKYPLNLQPSKDHIDMNCREMQKIRYVYILYNIRVVQVNHVDGITFLSSCRNFAKVYWFWRRNWLCTFLSSQRSLQEDWKRISLGTNQPTNQPINQVNIYFGFYQQPFSVNLDFVEIMVTFT